MKDETFKSRWGLGKTYAEPYSHHQNGKSVYKFLCLTGCCVAAGDTPGLKGHESLAVAGRTKRAGCDVTIPERQK